MRKTLLIAALSLGSISAQAQKIEIGLNGGMMLHKSDGKNFAGDPAVTRLKRDAIGSCGNLKAGIAIKKWQAGIGVEKYRTDVQFNRPSYRYDSDRSNMKSLSPYVFGNRLFKLPNSVAYAGINAGMCMGTAFTETDVTDLFIEAKYRGFTAGVQAGYTFYFTKHLGVNAEIGARYQKNEIYGPVSHTL
ncbi:MAG TPA: outer membrane beta-barrel protein [Flavipsychrobacter sp.]|nr:outer membrane beta-barrel protein [Flavipsychrobacter sp.]